MKKKIFLTSILLILIIATIAYMVYGYYYKSTIKAEKPVVTMEIADYGIVKIELYPEMAPNTVRNYIKLINEGYYNGLTFSRVDGNVIQGGEKTGDGATEYTIKGEFKENGFKENTLGFEKGTLGLARQDGTMLYYYTGDINYLTQGYNSGCAQFFITTKDMSEGFDGYYCAFGKVIEGMEIVDKIKEIETTTETNEETGETKKTETPVNPPVITKMTVNTKGIKYNEPEMIKE